MDSKIISSNLFPIKVFAGQQELFGGQQKSLRWSKRTLLINKES